jgi:23S rRNA (uracil1939-C5)-methyltransferase
MNVKFDSMAVGGDAVGRDETGRVVFAPFVAPGETCEVELVEEKKSFARARVLQVLEASPQRAEPPCPYFGRCGGSQWQHLEYEAQLEWKRRLVVESLSRAFDAKLVEEVCAPCAGSPPLRYRNKADWAVGVAPRGEEGLGPHRAQIGFFARASHDLVDIEDCPQQPPKLAQVLEAAREALRRGLVSPFEASSGRGVLRRVVARVDTQGGIAVTAVTTHDKWARQDEWAAWLRESVPGLVGVLRREPRQGPTVVWGRDWLEERVEGLKLRVDAEGFFQVNAHLTPLLMQAVRGASEVRKGQRALDIFCGVGLFALALARGGAQVLGLEIDKDAVRRARGNAKAAGLEAEFRAGDAARALQVLAGQGEKFDVVVLDPPRDGAKECMEPLQSLASRRIVYVSCDPQTLARDCKTLSSSYRLVSVQPFDLFPQTAHVETLAVLERF